MISVIVPAYNENLEIYASIQALDAGMRSAFSNIEIIVVDDGSTDGTSDLVSDPRIASQVVLIRNTARRGKGYAIRRGLSIAKGDVIVYTDADLPISLDSIISATKTVDSGSSCICVGDRFHPNTLSNRKGNHQRRFVSWIFRYYVHLLFPGLPHDPACCLKVFTRDVADLVSSKSIVDGYLFDIEACLIGMHAGAEIYEMPVTWVDKRPKLPWRKLLLLGAEGLANAFMLRFHLNWRLFTLYQYR